jgi:adenylate cyclase
MISDLDIKKARILIVDDLIVNTMLLDRMLTNAGYSSVTSVNRSKDVYALHQQNRYDLILLDLEMPGQNGFQVMEQLKEIESDGYLPVLVLTALPEYKLRALKAGAKDFISKPFELAEVLIRVRNMVEVRLLHLETKRLYNQVSAEKKVSERLLLNILPHAIAERLKDRQEVTAENITELIADSFDAVTVLFADIVDFTKFSGRVTPEELVKILNQVFTEFDIVADKCGLEKIKTIGDAYMAVAGLPVPVPDHSIRAARMALEMIEVMEKFNLANKYQFHIRIGISTGAAVAGVIGKRKFLYDLWGDVVNTASRMESHSIPDRIQITDSTRKNLGKQFLCEDRGGIDIKGKGEMNTWFLNSEDREYAFVSAEE